MEETFKKLSELIGKGGRIEESEKSIKRKKEKFFLDIISILCEIEAYQKISESVGISLVKYEDLHLGIFSYQNLIIIFLLISKQMGRPTLKDITSLYFLPI